MIALLNCCVLETCLLSNVYTKYTADVRICCMICLTILIIAIAGMISVCHYKRIESCFKIKEAQKKNEHDKDEGKTKLTKDILDKYLDQYLVILKKKGEPVAQVTEKRGGDLSSYRKKVLEIFEDFAANGDKGKAMGAYVGLCSEILKDSESLKPEPPKGNEDPSTGSSPEKGTPESKLPSESQYEKILATLAVAAMRGDMEKLELDDNFEIVLPKVVERNKGENQ